MLLHGIFRRIKKNEKMKKSPTQQVLVLFISAISHKLLDTVWQVYISLRIMAMSGKGYHPCDLKKKLI